jgi:hypothetical protein
VLLADRRVESSRPAGAAGIRRLWARAPILLLTVAVAASGALILNYDRHLTFVSDDWRVMTSRPGWGPDALLKAFNEHLILIPTVIFKALVELFGMGSALPFFVVSIGLFLLCAVLLYIYLGPRVGEWAALVGAVLVLFLGAAFEDLFWAFQMGFFGSVAAGLGALIALDREDDRGDRWACALLLVSIGCGGVGLAFVAAAFADLAFGRRPRRNRAWVALVPLALYVGWRLGWGETAGSQVSFETIRGLPRYVFNAAAAGTASLLGREAFADDGHPPLLASLLVIVLVFVAGARMIRQRQFSRGLAVALALALSYWLLIGLNRTGGHQVALLSRYQYPSAVFILVVAAELLRGVRIPRLAATVAAVVTAAAIVGGIWLMNSHYDGRWTSTSATIRQTTTALNIAGESAVPDRKVAFPPGAALPAAVYLRAADQDGSPAYTEEELIDRPGYERARVDKMLSEAMAIVLWPSSGEVVTSRCRRVPSPKIGGTSLGPGTYRIVNTGNAAVEMFLGRFSDKPRFELEPVPPSSARLLTIPPSRSDRMWRIGAAGESVALCLGGAAGARPVSGLSERSG